MKVKKFSIMPSGFSIEFALIEEDYNKKILNSNLLEIKRIIVAISGPLVNILITLIVGFFVKQNEIYSNILYANLLIFLFNMLPIYPLDGGRVLKSILCLMTKRKKGILYTNRISNITLFLISFLFSILIYYYKNLAIIVILLYLWYIVLRENKICRMKLKLYENLEKL